MKTLLRRKKIFCFPKSSEIIMSNKASYKKRQYAGKVNRNRVAAQLKRYHSIAKDNYNRASILLQPQPNISQLSEHRKTEEETDQEPSGLFHQSELDPWIRRKKLEQQQAGDQQAFEVPSEQGQQPAKPTTYKEWIASLPKSTPIAAEETPSGLPPPAPGPSTSSGIESHTIPTPGPSTSSAPESHTMTFRDWVAAQTAKAATEEAAPAADTLSIFLPESEVVVKLEVDPDEDMNPDVLDSSGQAMDTLIVDFGDTSFEREEMNSSSEITDKTNKKPLTPAKKESSTSNTEKRRSLRDRNALQNKRLAELHKSPKKKQSKFLLNDDRPLVKRTYTRRKPIMFDQTTTTEGLVYSENKSTSTEGLPIRTESEEKELFLQLCDKFLDEAATAAIRLTLNSKSDPSW